MTNQHDLVRNLIPLGEYRKPQFLFYDCKTSQLYAIDSYNSNSQSIWIWVGIVLVVPALRQLTNVAFIRSSVLKIISVILAIIISFIISGFFRKKSFENKRLYRVDKYYYQKSDFYSFASRTNQLVIEGFAFVCIASVVCLGLYSWGGDLLFLFFFCMMNSLIFTLIELNHLKRGQAIKQLKVVFKEELEGEKN